MGGGTGTGIPEGMSAEEYFQIYFKHNLAAKMQQEAVAMLKSPGVPIDSHPLVKKTALGGIGIRVQNYRSVEVSAVVTKLGPEGEYSNVSLLCSSEETGRCWFDYSGKGVKNLLARAGVQTPEGLAGRTVDVPKTGMHPCKYQSLFNPDRYESRKGRLNWRYHKF